MTDYDSYLNSLMAVCRTSVQRSSSHQGYPHISPQCFATPPTPPPLNTFKEPQSIAPRPSISRDLPATGAEPAAYTSRNVPSAATAPRPYVPKSLPVPAAGSRPYVSKNLPPAENTPRFRVFKKLPPLATAARPEPPRDTPSAAVDPPSNVNKNVPPNAPRSAISRTLSPAATEPSPFVPLFQLPIANAIPACASQKNHEPTTPICHVEARQDTRKGCIKEEPDKDFPHVRYKNMSQDAMRQELKNRGLLCHGPNADLVKRLEKDDGFQAKPRRAENYDTMNPKDVHSLCVRRSIPSQGTVSSLKDRLKAHDKRENRIEATVSRLSPLLVPSGHLSALEVKNSREMLGEKPLVPTVKDEPAAVTETAETFERTAETVTPAKPVECIESKPMSGMVLWHKACSDCRRRKRRCRHDANGNEEDRPAAVTETVEVFETTETVTPAKPIPYLRDFGIKPGGLRQKSPEINALPGYGTKCVESESTNDILRRRNRHKACSDCRKSKRRCIHDLYGEEDPKRAIEPAIRRPGACKAYIEDRTAPIAKKPTLAVQEVAPKCSTRLRLSNPTVSASENDKKPTLANEEFAGTHVTRSRVSDPKASASQNESRRPARTGRMSKDVKRKKNVPKSRRTPLLFQPKDEIILLQICVKLKDVIAWGNIPGFWNMVQDTLQLKTAKPYKKVSRHVRILVRKRRAEQQEIEQRGKISISRVSAGCRPLLDKWIAGGNRVHHISPNTSLTPTLIEDKDDMSLSEEVRQQLDPDDSALEVQKRSATDSWLDNSCDTTRRKKLKFCTAEPNSGTSKSCADSTGCWSLSGSSVTSESSIEDEGEDEDEDEDGDEDEDDVKSGD